MDVVDEGKTQVLPTATTAGRGLQQGLEAGYRCPEDSKTGRFLLWLWKRSHNKTGRAESQPRDQTHCCVHTGVREHLKPTIGG